MNLQGEPPSHKHGNTWEGIRDPCEGTKPGNCQGKSASTAQEKSEISRNIERHREKETKLDERHYRKMCLRTDKWNKLEHVIPSRQKNGRILCF